MITTYDKKDGSLYCRCCLLKRTCLHKIVTLWYLHERKPGSLTSPPGDITDTDDINIDICSQEETMVYKNGQVIYPPEGNVLKDMVEYIFATKCDIPHELPLELAQPIFMNTSCPRVFTPKETTWVSCKTRLPQPVLITERARILCHMNLVEGKKALLGIDYKI